MQTKERPSRGDAGWLSDGPGAGDDSNAQSKASVREAKDSAASGGMCKETHRFPPTERDKIAQRDRALRLANAMRLDRARLRADVKIGVLELDVVLGEKPECCAKMPVFEILTWIPGIQERTARRLITGLFSETLPVGALGEMNRARLLERLHARCRARARAS